MVIKNQNKLANPLWRVGQSHESYSDAFFAHARDEQPPRLNRTYCIHMYFVNIHVWRLIEL